MTTILPSTTLVFLVLAAASPAPSEARGPQPHARHVEFFVDRDVDRGITPITAAYLDLIGQARAGDTLIALQKYFKNPRISRALVQAEARGVSVLGIYRDAFEPSCSEVGGEERACSRVFVQRPHAHHKNAMLLRMDGTVRALVGSFNLRDMERPTGIRAHTALAFEIDHGKPVFDFYRAEAMSLLGKNRPAHPRRIELPAGSDGRMVLVLHPSTLNPALELLDGTDSCDGAAWASFFRAAPDAVGEPVFRALGQRAGDGCEVRVLLDNHPDNDAARDRLRSLGVNVAYQAFDGLLGHKLIAIRSNGRLHLFQGSGTNLIEAAHSQSEHNLSLLLVGAEFDSIYERIDRELGRYWPRESGQNE